MINSTSLQSKIVLRSNKTNENRNNYILFLLILLFPISCLVDIYNGYTNLFYGHSAPLALLYKGVLLISCIIFSINKKNSLGFIIIYVLLYSICFCFWNYGDHIYGTLQDEFSNFLKISYPYSVMLFLYANSKYITQTELLKNLLYFGIIASITIVGGYFIGIGVNSYGRELAYQFGTKGLFTAGNDIGLSIIMVDCLACYYLIKKVCLTRLIIVLLLSCAGLFIGSIAGIGGTSAVVLFLVYYILFNKNSPLTKSQRIIIIPILFIILFYYIFLLYEVFLNDSYFSARLLNLREGNSRGKLKIGAERILNDFDLVSWLFGISASGFRYKLALLLGKGTSVLTEMDFHDLIGYYGIILGGLMILVSFIFLFIGVKLYLSSKNLLMLWTSLALMLFILHGALAGHAYTSPTSSLIYSGLVGLIIITKNRI